MDANIPDTQLPSHVATHTPKVLDYNMLKKGVKFMIDGDKTLYTFVGFTSNDDNFIYLHPDYLVHGKDGNYDVGYLDMITDILTTTKHPSVPPIGVCSGCSYCDAVYSDSDTDDD